MKSFRKKRIFVAYILIFFGLDYSMSLIASEINPIVLKPGQAPKTKYDLGQLTTYFHEASSGAIRLSDERFFNIESDKKPIFEFDQKWSNRLVPISGNWKTEGQDFFSFDVEQFVEQMNGADFLDAKSRYYQKLIFSSKYHQYSRPYAYLGSWFSNFHPPLRKLNLPLDRYFKAFIPFDSRSVESKFFDPEFQISIDRETDTKLTFGNQLHLLPNNSSFIEKMRFIKTAEKSLWIAVMTVLCGNEKGGIIDEMVNAKKRGVDVRLIVENTYRDLISLTGTDAMKTLRKAGIQITYVNDGQTLNSIGRMMHHKFWIRDGREAILGGQNLLEDDREADGFNGYNRDTDVLIKKGPAVTDLEIGFVKIWNEYQAKRLNKRKTKPIDSVVVSEIVQKVRKEKFDGFRGQDAYVEWLTSPEKRMQGSCRVNVQGLNAGTMATLPILQKYAEASTQYIGFSSPTLYKVDSKNQNNPESKFLESISKKAMNEGLKVDIVSNGWDAGFGELTITLDKALDLLKARPIIHFPLIKIIESITYAFTKYSAKLNREGLRQFDVIPGIRTFTYMNYIHAKQYMFDRIATYIGSYNLDKNSTSLNHESGIICLDDQLRIEAETQWALDLVNSVPTVSLAEAP